MKFSDIHQWNIPEWLTTSVLVFALACAVHCVLVRLVKIMAPICNKKHNIWKGALLKGCEKPTFVLLWVTCAEWILTTVQASAIKPVFGNFTIYNTLVATSLITWIFFRFTKEAETKLLSLKSSETKLDKTTITAVGRLVRLIASIISILLIIQFFGVHISGILAFGGAGGLIVGYAAKDILANFFGGLVIYMDKPFGVGDWVRSPDQEIEGFVEYIGWRHTRIRTFDKRPLYVPNASFTTISVENPSRMENRRIKETIGLRYQDSNHIEAILTEIRDYLRDNDNISKEKITMVNFNSFGPSSLDFFIYCFTKTKDWAQYHMIKEQVLIDTLRIIHKHNADVAFPTQTIDLPDFIPKAVNKYASIRKKDLALP